ncbi:MULTISPECIES: fimbrial protein [unclassified Pseudomonas]|uniref:fimbrial protein n=1 Tax=unclassified Pseudomonas TaxID=196821 RepID=UPI00088AEFDE|nr:MULTISPECIES: fimbrial protein [unclassified Pseudomonas]SCZ10472.1 major type 1 subunit fimbrin (pilin) [Pseudomonas sp. NFACC37-1]SFO97441.1 major type 1 subunit fimbrin (pilin) [Pseudomonas sp. NFACC24-1]
MKQSFLALPLGLMLGMAASSAFATTGTINFEGMITDITCPIEIINPETGAPGNLVRLGRVASSQFAAIGDEAGHRDFAMRVTPGAGCTAPTNATVKFTGVHGATGAGNTLHALRSGTGYARGIGLAIMDNKGALISYGADSTDYPLDDTSPTDMRFTAAYKSTAASVSTGAAQVEVAFIVNIT